MSEVKFSGFPPSDEIHHKFLLTKEEGEYGFYSGPEETQRGEQSHENIATRYWLKAPSVEIIGGGSLRVEDSSVILYGESEWYGSGYEEVDEIEEEILYEFNNSFRHTRVNELVIDD